MGKEAHPLRLSGEKTRQNHLNESLAGKAGGKNVGTPKEGIFQTPEDTQSFFDGYGTGRLSQEEFEYFIDLYEFF
jgi:hypothetical protein